jgi:hypothetical protein
LNPMAGAALASSASNASARIVAQSPAGVVNSAHCAGEGDILCAKSRRDAHSRGCRAHRPARSRADLRDRADQRYRVCDHLGRLSIEGEYVLVVGPEIADLAGVLMDQDNDSVPAEVEDRFTVDFASMESARCDLPIGARNSPRDRSRSSMSSSTSRFWETPSPLPT